MAGELKVESAPELKLSERAIEQRVMRPVRLTRSEIAPPRGEHPRIERIQRAEPQRQQGPRLVLPSSPTRIQPASALRLAGGYGEIGKGLFRLSRQPAAFFEGEDFYRFRKQWGADINKGFGFKLSESGVASSQPGTLFVANHTSHGDSAIMLATIPAEAQVHFLAAAEFMPAVAKYAMKGDVFVDRQDPASRKNAVTSVMTRLSTDGKSMAMYPEGRRKQDGEPGEMKPGLLRAVLAHNDAIKNGASGKPIPIQPIAITGAHGAFESRLSRPFSMKVRVDRGPIRTDWASPEEVWNTVLDLRKNALDTETGH